MTIEFWEEVAKLAPIGTAAITLCAVLIAWRSIHVQRDTARCRTALDFFLKAETDKDLLELWYHFKKLVPEISAIISRPTLNEWDEDYQTLRKWLNLCELIAVGINKKAFSEKVSYDYWGYTMPDSYFDAELLIKHIRQTRSLGGPMTYHDLQIIAEKWKKTDDRSTAP